MITFSNYKQVESLEEAWMLNQKRSNIILGGMVWLKMSRKRFNTVIDLSGLGLSGITETEEAFEIGCMTSLRELECHPGLNRYSHGAIKESLKHIVGVQLRNTATVGGSVFARFGFSDVLTMLLAMDSEVVLYRGGTVPMKEFVTMKKDHDILVKILIKKTPGSFSYHSVRNTKTDFPVLSCAVSKINGQVRAAVGARPMRATLLEDPGYCKSGCSAEAAADLGRWVSEQIETGDNLRGSAAYRKHLAAVLVKRGCLALGEQQEGDR